MNFCCKFSVPGRPQNGSVILWRTGGDMIQAALGCTLTLIGVGDIAVFWNAREQRR